MHVVCKSQNSLVCTHLLFSKEYLVDLNSYIQMWTASTRKVEVLDETKIGSVTGQIGSYMTLCNR